ncbi:MerR family transcriptional regulator [Simiduia aestuariiviva]|uniref:DNA-binding transcriptional MerR regulator n=1 Tax=Simiduia aestuariiviva TaxID=1510459 RepID=A0A839UX88_9GAMM|nr:MerR family transcriptional regulator [Simiduia aestuariiviva]MBB3169977.1 DNA-binding transcriptional MerR regulator [Simiduia aestuariiviva]
MKIGDVSEALSISTHTIRYYEKQGLIPNPGLDVSGHRSYSPGDVELLNWIICLKKSGMSLASIRAYTSAFRAQDQNTMSQILALHAEKLRQQQQDIQHYLEVTEHKLKKLKGLT